MTAQSSAVVTFNFVAQAVRVIVIDDEPWFVASDVCAALDCNTEQTRRLDDDEKGLHTVQTPGGNQQVTIINESGLYSLILTSRKPEAKKFKKWVTSEVLPAIRKTGRYTAPTGDPLSHPYHYPRDLWQLANRKGGTGWLTYNEITRLDPGDRPIARLLTQLTRDGHDIEGARIEYCALRHLLESMYWALNDIADRANSAPRRGLRLHC